MIELNEIILRLRQKAPIFERRVGGTAALGQVLGKDDKGADLEVPCCFVSPMSEQNLSAAQEGISTQVERRREYFSTSVCVDNTPTGGTGSSGQMKTTSMAQMKVCQEQIENAWARWVPEQKFDKIRFHRGAVIGMSNKRLWYQFEWYTEYDNNTDATTELENAANAIIRGLTEEEDTTAGSEIGLTEKIYVRYRDVYFPPRGWPDDFFPWPAGIPEPTEQQVQQAISESAALLRVSENPSHQPTALEIGSKVAGDGLGGVDAR